MTITLDTNSRSTTAELFHSKEEHLEAMAKKVYEAKLPADKAAAAFKEIDTEFRRELEDAGLLNSDTKGFGPIHTTIFETRRFDETLAQRVLDEAVKARRITRKEIDACYVQKLDSKKLQEVISPALYDKMQKVSGMTVKYSLSEH